MLITKIEVQKRNKGRANIYLDGEFYCGLSLETVMKNRIKEGQEISQIQMDFLKSDTERELALSKAVTHISKTPKTKKELRAFLFKKGFEDEIVDFAISKLEDYGFINDENYAKSYVLSKSKSQGKRKILFDLKRKGIEENLANESLENFSKEKDSIFVVCEKYLKNKEKDIKTKQKTYRYLSSKGYLNEDIISCLNSFFREEN